MEYIKPIFLLLFVLGIAASVSSRYAAKYYLVEDAGNQDESSLVKKTLKRHGSSLTSALDFGEEKNKRKVNSVSDMGDSTTYLYFNVYNPKDGSPWSASSNVYLVKGIKVMQLPNNVSPGEHMHYHVEEATTVLDWSKGAAGVFTYNIPAKDLTLAVMFDRDVYPSADFANTWINVKLYDGSIDADQALYSKMKKDDIPEELNGVTRFLDLGSGFGAHVAFKSKSGKPTVEITIEMLPSLI